MANELIHGRSPGHLTRGGETLAESVEVSVQGVEDSMEARFVFAAGEIRVDDRPVLEDRENEEPDLAMVAEEVATATGSSPA
jgi:hypothetical protein